MLDPRGGSNDGITKMGAQVWVLPEQIGKGRRDSLVRVNSAESLQEADETAPFTTAEKRM